MKLSVKIYKIAGIVLLIAGIALLSYHQLNPNGRNIEIVIRSIGVLSGITGTAALIYANEQQNKKISR